MKERENNKHYSEQTGHFLRGKFARLQQRIFGPDDPHSRSIVFVYNNPVENQRIRRSMFRNPRDGRR